MFSSVSLACHPYGPDADGRVDARARDAASGARAHQEGSPSVSRCDLPAKGEEQRAPRSARRQRTGGGAAAHVIGRRKRGLGRVEERAVDGAMGWRRGCQRRGVRAIERNERGQERLSVDIEATRRVAYSHHERLGEGKIGCSHKVDDGHLPLCVATKRLHNACKNLLRRL